MNEPQHRAQNIRCVIFDVDGVFTDGRIYLSETGHEFKAFHAHDGMGIKMLIKAQIAVGVISSRESKLVQSRLSEIGIKHIYQGQYPKDSAYEKLKKNLALDDHQIAYVGDDINDLSIIRQCGLGVAVANAVPLLREHAIYQTTQSGGNGAIREVVEFILTAQNKLTAVHAEFL